MSVYLEKTEDVSGIKDVLLKLAGISEFEAYRFRDDFGEEHKCYDVFKIVYPGGALVLKQPDGEKCCEAEKAVYGMCPEGLPLPKVYGFADGYMLSEYIEGEDLKNPTDEGITAAAESLAAIMNAFPIGKEYDRTICDKEIAYREKRSACLQNEPLLRQAYQLFLERLKEMPLTLGNGDFVPINCIYTGERVYIIDWEYGGFMPYALDIARFIAHSGEEESDIYRLTAAQRKLFINTIYDLLDTKPARNVFERDIRLALLDEYVMVLGFWLRDPEKQRDGEFQKYYKRAEALARELTGQE